MNASQKSITRICYLTIAGLCMCSGNILAGESTYPIAGTQPDARPKGAPTAPRLERTNDWYSHAVTGVDEPYPASLQFLESQGRWYTPFNRPGMPGLYDIRGWHRKK